MDVLAAIRHRKWARPTRPFRLLTKDGRRLDVTAPPPPTGRIVLLVTDDEGAVWFPPGVEGSPTESEAADGSR